jgi:lipid A 3-O-deacylase
MTPATLTPSIPARMNTRHKLIAGANSLLLFSILALMARDVRAQEQQPTVRSPFAPSSWFAQAGTADNTHALTVGLTWDLAPRWKLGGGEVTTYVEASLSGWSYERARGTDGSGVNGGNGRSQLAQLGVIPVLRYRPDEGHSPWFFEAGMGITLTSKVYATEEKRFSTAFNFGTHLGFGRSFGAHGEHEISLRVEHFSNAGIKHPNPGENFVQLRYAFRFM